MDKLKNYKKLLDIYEKYTKINIRLENYKEDLLKIYLNLLQQKEEYGVLLCKLKNEILRCEFILNDGCGEDHARWTTVCPIKYTFEIDNDLVKEIY